MIRSTAKLLLATAVAFTSWHAHAAAEKDSSPTDIFDSRLTWKDESGADVKLAQWRESRLFVTMSYTACKKYCPRLTIAKLKELQAALDRAAKSAEFVIITFDPNNDTPAVLSEFKKKNQLERKNWHFLVGSLDDTKTIAKLLQLDGFWRMDDHILHDFRIATFAPGGREIGALDWHDRDVEKLLAHLE